jgi:hypothetical protein
MMMKFIVTGIRTFWNSKIYKIRLIPLRIMWIDKEKIKLREIIEKEQGIVISNSATIFTRQKVNRLVCLEMMKVMPANNKAQMFIMKE